MKEMAEGFFNLEDPNEMEGRMETPRPTSGMHVPPMGYNNVPTGKWDSTFGAYCTKCKKCHKEPCTAEENDRSELICEFCLQPYDDAHIHDSCKLDPE